MATYLYVSGIVKKDLVNLVNLVNWPPATATQPLTRVFVHKIYYLSFEMIIFVVAKFLYFLVLLRLNPPPATATQPLGCVFVFVSCIFI